MVGAPLKQNTENMIMPQFLTSLCKCIVHLFSSYLSKYRFSRCVVLWLTAPRSFLRAADHRIELFLFRGL